MRILITGSAGQLGREIVRALGAMENELGALPKAYEGAEVHAVDRDELDIADASAVEAWFARRGPYDMVFNCAAYTNVDGCEVHEADAARVNADGPENLAQACAADNGILVHVSTDYVFPGTESGARIESDPVGPLSAYGRTKLTGEQRTLAANPRTHVVRTAWLYGYEGANFVRTMMRLGAAYDEVTVVEDQVGNPTSAADLAFALLRIGLSDSYGVWHATCEGECSWADFAEAIMAEAGLPCRVERCTSAQWREMHPESAVRPAFSGLENGHMKATIGNSMRSWRTALASFMAHDGVLGKEQ